MTLPRGWASATIGDVTAINPKHSVDTDGSQSVSFVPMPAVDEHLGAIVDRIDKTLDEIWTGYTHFADGDVIFAKITPCMENGKAAVASGLTNGLACGSTEFYVFRPEDGVDASYLWRFLRQNSFRAEAEKHMTGAVGQRRVPRSYLENHGLPLPPWAEQRRIVAKLDSLTARIARARAELDRVPVLASKLRSAALSALRRQLQSVPAIPVSEIASSTFDGPFGSNLKSSDYTSSGVRVIRLENIGRLRFIAEKRSFISEEKYKVLARHTLMDGDILFSSFVDQDIRVCQFKQQDGLAINKADCFVVRVDPEKFEPRFVSYMLASPETYEAMKSKVHGATRPRIGLKQLRDYRIGAPAREKQVRIADSLDAAFARADRLEAEATRVRKLLDRLEAAVLAKAFRGELVQQDPNDEPASVLLERIRAERAAAPLPKRGRRATS
ncbi:restriction endonuclease subunit S [Sinorhizobium sp. CCBAU 05631]|uniref:restriction endonuclease subunit S n=1 Tax=Sinorhizobium sp. CCBAU 05631 TaxID=794846 RepID=UPI0004B2E7A8|nr:restriction endonuclease subunit S [Sinorhizobium sp. CCBAU 05631]ASY58297.1 Type I restriction-modification system, specificity subunit S [Sinorhizobium sp. CCBAU 05631]